MTLRHSLAFAMLFGVLAAGCQSDPSRPRDKMMAGDAQGPRPDPTVYPHMKAADLTAERLAAVNTVVSICAGTPIPDGWVVISWGNSMNCPGWTPGGMNVMNIKKPGPSESVCSGSPIPPGYVVTSWSNSMSCPGWTPGGMNVMNIKIPGANETVCAGSPIPPGYVVTGMANSMSCPGWTPGGQNQKVIKKVQ